MIRLQGCLERAGPAKLLKLRRDLGVIHVRIIAAARTDDFENIGVAAFGAAVHDVNRLAPHEGRPAMTALPGKRERHLDRRPHTQPRVAALIQTRRRPGVQTDSGPGADHKVRVTKTAHSTHRQAAIPALILRCRDLEQRIRLV